MPIILFGKPRHSRRRRHLKTKGHLPSQAFLFWMDEAGGVFWVCRRLWGLRQWLLVRPCKPPCWVTPALIRALVRLVPFSLFLFLL
jgi:hypothetical protein